MILKKPMLPAEMAGAEPAIADNPLRRVSAFFEGAADFLGGHPAAEGERHVEGCVWGEGERREGRGRRGEVFPCVDEAQVGGGEVVAEGEEGGEGGY